MDSAQGPGTQQIEVDPRQGTWAVVVMNGDGHPAVAAELQAEVTLPWFRRVTTWTFRVGVALPTVGAALVLIGATTSGLRRAGS